MTNLLAATATQTPAALPLPPVTDSEISHRTLALIRRWLLFFMIALLFSGLTAIPVEPELQLLLRLVPGNNSVHNWLEKVLAAYQDTRAQYPFLLYGYDWLAFAHIILAILFIGPYKDPVRNIWVIQFGMIACLLIFPLALIAGPFRGIPLGWQLIDCSFGLAGLPPLWIAYRKTKQMEKTSFINNK